MDLLPLERIALSGMAARDREITERVIRPLEEDFSVLARAIETRLGLSCGAIGSTHYIDEQTFTVVAGDDGSAPHPASSDPTRRDSDGIAADPGAE